jgi:hypothetical protein
MKKPTSTKASRRGKQTLPRGWNEKRVQKIIDYYDRQTEDEELAEYEAAMEVDELSVMFVPKKLVPEIRQLIAQRRGA